MCIVFISTSHPKYSLILANNRDEFVLRPTSRPHWWNHINPNTDTTTSILSSRDLQRPERGTWLGITKDGLLAVLTNFRETDANGPSPKGRRSRGGMVTAWLSEPPKEGVRESVKRLVEEGEGVKGVGGFSIACGKLKKKGEGFAIISNRAGNLEDVPIVSPEEIKGWGLTNTAFTNSSAWPKISEGLGPFDNIVKSHADSSQGEESLIKSLFNHLDRDTLHGHADKPLAENIRDLKTSIFIPAIGGDKQRQEMAEAQAQGKGRWPSSEELEQSAPSKEVAEGVKADDDQGFDKGMYGTQRQTIVLVSRQGEVTFVERALWDANGHAIERGEGDVTFRFQIEGWEDE